MYPDLKYFMISAATWQGIEELKDYLVENIIPEKVIVEKVDESTNEERKIYDLQNEGEDPKQIHVEYEGDLRFRAYGKRLEQIVRMTDFDNGEAIMRVYNVLEKMGVISNVQKKLEKIMKDEGKDNSFFFEGSNEENISPKILVWEAEIPLQKLKYKL